MSRPADKSSSTTKLSAITSSASLTTVNVLGPRGYTLEETIGKGSYSKVKRFWSKKYQRKVAIKVIDQRKTSVDFSKNFLPRELKLLPEISHSNIVKVFEILQYSHLVFVVEELAARGDLLEKIQQEKRVKEAEAKLIIRQLAEAVHYLHCRQIAHRDVKCENVFLDTNNNVKLGDFGFARKMNADDLSTTFCGSKTYSPPEIVLGRPYHGFCADWWSFGVVLYVTVTGLMPYDDTNMRRTIDKQLKHIVPFHTSIYSVVSNECKRLICSLLQPTPSARFRYRDVINSDWLKHTEWHMQTNIRDNPTAVDFDKTKCYGHSRTHACTQKDEDLDLMRYAQHIAATSSSDSEDDYSPQQADKNFQVSQATSHPSNSSERTGEAAVSASISESIPDINTCT